MGTMQIGWMELQRRQTESETETNRLDRVTEEADRIRNRDK